MKPQSTLIGIILGFFIISCNNKDDLMMDLGNYTCEEHFELVSYTGTPLFHLVFPFYSLPCFNPNNGNELIFKYASHHTEYKTDFPLIKYNLITESYEEVINTDFGTHVDWSVKDWILLSRGDRNIYKVKSNGDSLTQLTFNNISVSPVWNLWGDRFISRFFFSDPYEYIVYDENGTQLDTLKVGNTGAGSWHHSSLIAYTDTFGFYISDPDNNQVDTMFLLDQSNSICRGGADWISEEEVIWAHLDGIRITNIVSGQSKLIKETCNAKYYQNPTFSPQLQKVVFQVIERVVTNREEGPFERGILAGYLVIMNLDGSEEEIIEL